MNRLIKLFAVCMTVILPSLVSAAPSGDPWTHVDAEGRPVLDLYFFWSHRCPHCNAARPVVERIAAERGWLKLHSLEVLNNEANLRLYADMAGKMGRNARSVPAFLYCGTMQVGFDGSGLWLAKGLDRCYAQLLAGDELGVATAKPGGESITVPLLGDLQEGESSLWLVTLVIAALDAFNPCAFFVLLFLLSLLVNTRSRKRMLFIGGVFVFFSGAIYFLFMAAWLNLFLLTGMQAAFTVAAGLVAVALALVNIKDFFFPGRGLSLSIPEEKKPGLFKRMRALLQADNLPALTLGTVTLAIAANSYELLCTSGLPMVYTRVLTLEGLSSLDYYLYLLLYNLIYIVPLLMIVLLFSATLGRRKLQPNEGRLLKLLSGSMMLLLGLGLLLKPELLSSVEVVAASITAAIAITLAAALWLRR